MLRDIKTGVVKADLILCDTLERFGRVDELPVIRKQLYERYGVLILTADSHFADPTTPSGRALGVVESLRATENGRVKAHNVLRGKRDAAHLGHWPGGLPPFGLALKTFFKNVNGRDEVDYCILVPNPETAWIIQLLFTQAKATGWGQSRLCKWLNDSPEIPEKFKPLQASTVGYWLNNPIYIGELRWAWNSTGIVDDKRVKQRNAEEDVIRVAGFCEPLVDRETWNDVQLMRRKRREVFEKAQARNMPRDSRTSICFLDLRSAVIAIGRWWPLRPPNTRLRMVRPNTMSDTCVPDCAASSVRTIAVLKKNGYVET
jgi:hypothetical protein